MARASITSSRDFRRVYRSGKKARVDGVSVWAAPGPDEGRARLGMAVRASVGTAVDRNRLRRRLREIFRAYGPLTGTDVVIHATREAAGRNFQELEDVTVDALSGAGVRRTA